jgi:hypothetical protein
VLLSKWYTYADGDCIGNALSKSLCLFESPAGNDDLDTRLAENLSSWAGDETSTEQQNRPGELLAQVSLYVLRLHSLSGRVDPTENGLELVCNSQYTLNRQASGTH